MNHPNVSGRNLFYSRQASADDLQRMAQANQQARMNSMMMNTGMGDMGMIRGQSLDELVIENNKEQQRRNFQHLGNAAPGQHGNLRRLSMMEFGTGQGSGMDHFNFQNPSMVSNAASVPNGSVLAKQRMESQREAMRRQSADDLGLDTRFDDMNPSFGNMTQSPIFQQPMDTDALDLNPSGTFMQDVQMNMDYGGSMDAEVSPVPNSMPMFQQQSFSMPLSSSMPQQAGMPISPRDQDAESGVQEGAEQTMLEKMPQMNMTDTMMDTGFDTSMITPASAPPNGLSRGPTASSTSNNPALQGLPAGASSNLRSEPFTSEVSTAANNFSTGTTLPNQVSQPRLPNYLNAYSQTGFDMLGVLMRVAARPKPQINIGAVDMSCAFVVCDVTKHDVPIVYCSEMFERLTGYTRHEILGRNCRFLQAPDGKVQSGLKRKYVDDQSVWQVKTAVSQHQEAQISLINYRKGGQPFMNLLTMIPIAWDTDEMKYYVGFQVDLVDQPASITNKNPDGTYAINYQRGLLPRYVLHTPDANRAKDLEMGPPLERDDVSMVLSTLGTGETDLSKRIWDKVLLENTDDVLHVLSLKGLFLYLSQASRKILEYEPHELVGTALSSVCHPSDIVPVTRELKDTSPGATVNVVYRIRRKHSGYTWFEAHGALHTEQGKGKKCIILVGRERPVYALQRSDLVNAAEIGENELWTKMSTSGMFLFVSSHARSLLDRQPDELRGTSAQALMRAESKAEFNRMLDLARIGVKSTFKHDIQNRRGQTLHAQTTLYPGDACEGQKPTFLVAQTKLLKMSRSAPSTVKQTSNASDKSMVASAGSNTPSTAHSGGGAAAAATAQPLIPAHRPMGEAAVVTKHGGAALAIGTQHQALASEDNVFEELKTTRSTSWQFELRQMEKRNRVLAEEMQSLNSSKKKRKRRKGLGQLQKDCANCHTRSTPEWRRGPSGQRDLCNSCGLRWAKQNGRVSPRTSSQHSDKNSMSPINSTSPNPNDGIKGGGGIGAGSGAAAASNSVMSPTGKSWTQPQRANADSHNAKTARMEAQAMAGYGGGIPAKIEEVSEPAD